jgi:phage gp29-like protein
MSQLLTRITAPPGTPLAALGGLPPIRGQVQAAAAKSTGDTTLDLSRVENLSPSLAAILRPQAAYRWLLPYLASITPQYVEGILRGALAGNHVQAWELFDLMIDTDPEIAACVQEYTDGICGKKVHFEPYCEEGEEPTPSALERCKLVSAAYRNMRPDAAADENGFDGTIKDIIASRFHGQSILEIDWLNTWGDQSLFVKNISGIGNVAVPRATYWVHPVCYAYDMNGRLGLRMSLTDSNGTSIQTATKLAKDTKMGKANPNPGQLNYVDPPAWNFVSAQPRPSMLMEFPRNKFLISIMKAKTGTALGGSCLRPLAWWWVASNFCGDWLLNYAQLFGIPFRKATYKANTSETVKAEIRQMLQSAGSSGYILLPDSADLEFMKDGAGAGQSPQAFLFTFADSQKRKVILHQTQTGGHSSGGGGGFAGKFGEVEAQTKDACMGAGCRHVENVINQQFTPFVLEMNYGQGNDLEAPTCKLVDNKVGGLVDAQRDQVLVQIMDVGEDWMRRKYGVPKPGPGEKLCGQEVGSQVGQKQMDQDLQLKQSKISADATVQSAKHNADATKAAAAMSPKGSNTSSDTDNADLQDEAESKAAKEAADAARAGMQDALEASNPEGINQWTHRVHVAMSDPIQVGGTQAHNKVFKKVKMVAKDDEEAKVKATKFYQKRGYKNIHVVHVEKPGESDSVESFSATAPASLQAADATPALAETIQPLLARLKAIDGITDKDARRLALQKFLKDFPSITAAMKHDDSVAKAVTPDAVAAFVTGLKSKPKTK